MSQFKRRPTPPIEAVQFTDPSSPPKGVQPGVDGSSVEGRFFVTTLRGTLTPVSVGEWVVTEQSDPTRHYPIADGEFQRLYEPVSSRQE